MTKHLKVVPLGMAGAMLLFLLAPGALFALTGGEILARVDHNVDFKSISYTGTMIIHSGRTVRTKTMQVIAVGTSKALVEFTNPEDRDTKYLKIDQNLWIYFPSAQDTVKISGQMLNQGMMGSSVSYRDALESSSLAKNYNATLSGVATVDGRACYVLDLTAKVRNAAYAERKMWVDEQRFIPLREEMYAQSGLLLKVERTLRVEHIGDRWFPANVEISDKLVANSSTAFDMTSIAFDVPVNERIFSLFNLER